MRKIFPAEELARDARFIRQTNEQRLSDPRGARIAGGNSSAQLAKLTPEIEARFDALVGVIPGRLTRAKVVEQCLQKLQDETEGSGE